MATLDVRLLGPLEVRVDGGPVAIPRGNAATVLAILLDEANNVVPLSDIVDSVYGIDLPADPETQVQNTIGVLRRKLLGARDRLVTVNSAYRFDIETHELDTLRCKAKENQARALRQEGRLAEAAAALRDALAESRGPAFADHSGPFIEALRRRYDEHRPTLLERRLDLDLELGRAAEVVDELRRTVAANATRQPFTALLMRALHACGRTAEALEAYAALKEVLAEGLGADPDPALRDLHTAILRDPPTTGPSSPALTAETPFPRPIPALLPRANTRFTGRSGQLATLDGFLEDAEGAAGLAVVTGMGGVGKTALAVSWAHRVAHRFPDGQLYFNLRGFDPLAAGVDPSTVLGEALVALGVETHHLPAGMNERIGLYRTLLSQRSVLVVLDNARDAAQVRPLLPVAAGSFTLVTSRDRLAGLDATEGAETVPLDLLSEADAWALLVRRIGIDRAMAEERPVLRIVAACGRLPLALTLIGAWAAAHPQFSLAALADRLESTTNVFRVLASSDLASDPRSVFACSYQALGGRAARAFRLFGLHPGPDLTVAAMASLMGAPAADAEAALHELADVHLVDQPREGRYTMHDLLRSYAAERFADEVAAPDRDAAETRLIDYFIHSTSAADFLVGLRGDAVDIGEPGPGVVPESITDSRAAAAWFTTEYDVLLGLLRRETLPGGDVNAWRLAWCMAGYMVDRSIGKDLLEAQTIAYEAARRSGDGFGQVVSLGYLSAGAMFLGDQQGADRYIERAMSLADDLQQPWAKGLVCYAHAILAARRDDDAGAVELARRALAHFEQTGDPFWIYRSEWVVAWHGVILGELDENHARFERLLATAEALDVAPAVANAHLGHGLIAHKEGRFEEALRRYALGRELLADYGLPLSAALVGELVADVLEAQGDLPTAIAEWRRAERACVEHEARHELIRIRSKLARSLAGPPAAESEPATPDAVDTPA